MGYRKAKPSDAKYKTLTESYHKIAVGEYYRMRSMSDRLGSQLWKVSEIVPQKSVTAECVNDPTGEKYALRWNMMSFRRQFVLVKP